MVNFVIVMVNHNGSCPQQDNNQATTNIKEHPTISLLSLSCKEPRLHNTEWQFRELQFFNSHGCHSQPEANHHYWFYHRCERKRCAFRESYHKVLLTSTPFSTKIGALRITRAFYMSLSLEQYAREFNSRDHDEAYENYMSYQANSVHI